MVSNTVYNKPIKKCFKYGFTVNKQFINNIKYSATIVRCIDFNEKIEQKDIQFVVEMVVIWYYESKNNRR